jgi:filamentous hemagglutinin
MRLRSIMGGIAFSLFSLLGASQAFAQQTCDNPVDGQTSVNLVVSGDCNITQAINVSGSVNIQVTGGSLTTASNIGGSSVSISESGGTTTLAGVASGSGAVNVSSDGTLSMGSVSSQNSVTASSGSGDINVSGAIYVEGGVQLTANNGKINSQAITANFQDITLSSSGTLTFGAVSSTADLTATSTNGDIDVTDAVSVNGAVKLTAANGKIDAQAITSGGNLISLNAESIQGTSLTAGAYVYAKSTTGSINFSGNVTSNTTGDGYGLQLYAQSDLAAGSLSNAGTNGGWIDIWSNLGGASSPFTIGGSGSTNGINGTITATGGSSNSTLVLIQNGTASSTGDITLVNASGITTTNSGAATGNVWINANQGTVTIQSGTLSVDGSGTQDAGGIVLMGSTISAPSGAALSAVQSTSAPLVERGIILAASTINFGGSGLNADAAGGYGEVVLLPTGAVTITDNMGEDGISLSFDANYSANGSVTLNGSGSPLNLIADGTNGEVWINAGSGNVNISASALNLSANGTNGQVDVFANTGSVAFNGSGNALTLTANGDNGQINVDASSGGIGFNNSGGSISLSANGNGTQVNVNAYPLTFTGSSLSVTANGNSSNFIGLGVGSNTQNGSAGITFDITGATVIDASAAIGQSSGNINIWEDQVTINGTSFAMLVNGPSSGDGNAGALSLLWANTILNPATTASFSANGPSSGNGNGGSITYWPGAPSIAFGSSAGQLAFTAKGGATTGNGGSINISGNDMSFNGVQAGVMDVSVPGTTGNGGTINVSGGNVTFSGTGYMLAANAGSQQGNGGTVSLSAFAAMTIGNSSGGVVLSAQGQGTGNGGSVTASGLPLTADGASINVSAGTASGSNGNGGQINLTSNFTFGNPWLSGNLTANGNGAGNGGTITITTDSAISFDDTTQLIAQSLGTGNGGSISINSQGAITINADSILVSPGSASGSNGAGGNVTIASTGTGSNGLISLNADIDASGAGTGTGGTLTVNGDSVQLNNNAQLVADGGDEGNGGSVSVTTTGTTAMDWTSAPSGAFSVSGNGSGNSGSITVKTQSDLSLSGPAFDANSDTAGSGNGGQIVITTTGNLTTTGTLVANGGCDDGNDGEISLTGANVNIDSIGEDGSTLCPDGGTPATKHSNRVKPLDGSNNTGNGPTVVIQTDMLTGPTEGKKINANARTSNGNGGILDFSQVDGWNLAPYLPNTFTALGGSNGGNGGQAILKSNSHPFDVYSLIKVDGGTVTEVAPETGHTDPSDKASKFDGSVSIGGVVCQQWRIGQGTNGSSGAQRTAWPLVYWNCANPVTPSLTDQQAVIVAISTKLDNLRTRMAAKNPVLYVFTGAGPFDTYFDQTEAPLEGGLTFTLGTLYSAPWESGSHGSNQTLPYTAQQYSEVVGHELGHVVDLSFVGTGQGKPSVSTPYLNYMTQDQNTFNYADPGFSVPRLPCAPTPNPAGGNYPGNIPFANAVVPNTTTPICKNNALNPDATPSGGWPTTNMGILSAWMDSLWSGTPWIEPHAQIFAYELVGNQGARSPVDSVFDNGYFPCTAGWSTTEQSNALPGGTCSATPVTTSP